MMNIISTALNIWIHPWQTMARLKEKTEEGLKPSIIFILALGVVSGLLTAMMAFIFPPALVVSGEVPKMYSLLAIILYPLGSLIGSFIGAFILWGIVFGWLKGSGLEYKAIYRLSALLAAFSPVVALLSPLPKAGPALALVINLWALAVLIQGIIIVFETPKVRTWVVMVVIFGLLLLLNMAVRFATESNLAGRDFPQIGAGAPDDLNFDEEALNNELEGLISQENQK